jgi:nucleoside-diphosphate-sugar epimerase
LVTGGTGLVGSTLLKKLVEENKFSIRAIRRASSRMDLVKNLEEKVEWVEAELSDIESLERAFEGISYVFHCAAMVSFFAADTEKMHEINVDGTANIVNLSLKFSVKKLVHVSSVAAIGRSTNSRECTENTKWVPSANNTNYAKTKYLSEMEVWRGFAEGLDVAIVNPTIVLGDGFFDEGSIRFFRQIKDGLKFYPPGANGFVDARDVADFMIKLMNSPISAERFILCGKNLEYKIFFEKIAERLHVSPPKIRVNKFMAEFAWIFGVFQENILKIKPLVTKETARTSLEKWVYRNEKSIKMLDFEYRDFETTMDFCCERFLDRER